MRKQKGMTMIGWIITLAIGLLLALAVLRLVPVYLNYMKIHSIVRDLPSQMQGEKVSPKTIRQAVAKRWDIEGIYATDMDHLDIQRDGDNYLVTVDYEHRVPFIANINFLAEFSASSKVKR